LPGDEIARERNGKRKRKGKGSKRRAKAALDQAARRAPRAQRDEERRARVRAEVDAQVARWQSEIEQRATEAGDPVAVKLLPGATRSPPGAALASPPATAALPTRRSARRLLARWRGSAGRPPLWRRVWAAARRRRAADPHHSEHIQRSLPRRKSLLAPHTDTSAPTMRRKVQFKVSYWHTVARILVWTLALVRFGFGGLIDWILRRASRQRSAIRLRHAFERMGGTVIKIGQQMGMRTDLLPYEYTNELSNMLDKVPAFPTRLAVDAILRTMRAKNPAVDWRFEDIFETFDPVPIGAASVSCVYQAVLKTNGEKVAVKVRRPNIGPVFMADCQALSWILRLLEVLTILRPGLSKNLIAEFRTMLIDELDFVKEARNSELFRRRLKRGKLYYAGAPEVYFDYSSDEVLICEFVRGIWLTELLSAVEHKDEKLLALLAELNIEPKLVAKRLLQVNQFSIFENILFHADPHPGNVVVQPNSVVVFIDFGACGSYTHKERYVWRQLMMAQANEDVSQMAACALAVIEPLPPIDLDEFQKRVENVFWQDLHAFKSKHSEWWERTSAGIWISFLELSREYDIPLNLNTLRMIRSTLLYDTIAARLFSGIDSYKEHHRYAEKAGKRARKRVHHEVHRLAARGPRPGFYLRLEQLAEMANRIVYRAQRFLDDPPFHFAAEISKSVYGFLVVIRMLVMILGGGVGLSSYYLVLHLTIWRETDYTISDAFYDMLRNRWMLVYSIVAVLIHVRRLGFRLRDKETE
jgi:predicted unusual protein kinase regulating ubiquinone biosynthesis (AarF/ABC1/UbiB family)